MTLRVRLAAILVAVAAFGVWRSQLFVVSRPGEQPRPLTLRAVEARAAAPFDVTLPQVPIGARRLSSAAGVLVVHFWAPWERHASRQAAALDSLSHLEEFRAASVVVVCFDPFPSVTRYVARQRLRLCVLLDHERALRRALPCPSIPYTYVLDRAGRIAVAQSGEVDWLAGESRETLRRLLAEPPAEASGRTSQGT
jgi:hypothetical protein